MSPVIPFLDLRGTTISAEVTAYQLLTHTSGIGDDVDEEAGESYEAVFVDRRNYSVRQTADFLPQFIHKPPNFQPGTSTRYCNVSYMLLGLMVERATGVSFRDYVREHVFARAGMGGSGFFAMDDVEPDSLKVWNPLWVTTEPLWTGDANLFVSAPLVHQTVAHM